MLAKSSIGELSTRARRVIFGTLLVGAAMGLVASTVLSYEAIVLAKNSSASLSCDLSSVVSCGTVGRHWSAHLFGDIPNSFIGMAAFPVFITIAVAGLANVRFPRWFMRVAQLGAVVGILFAAWMLYMSYAVIGALCPWCLTTDVGTLLVLLALVRYNALTGNLCVHGKTADVMEYAAQKNYDIVGFISVVVIIVAAIIVKFGAGLF